VTFTDLPHASVTSGGGGLSNVTFGNLLVVSGFPNTFLIHDEFQLLFIRPRHRCSWLWYTKPSVSMLPYHRIPVSADLWT